MSGGLDFVLGDVMGRFEAMGLVFVFTPAQVGFDARLEVSCDGGRPGPVQQAMVGLELGSVLPLGCVVTGEFPGRGCLVFTWRCGDGEAG